ncbi:uncharacterized protein TNCV_3982241 [Trichonephila clavipes]|nr:uncharacterized protein TNCV_3982241 [Trichonephila clavipes]
MLKTYAASGGYPPEHRIWDVLRQGPTDHGPRTSATMGASSRSELNHIRIMIRIISTVKCYFRLYSSKNWKFLTICQLVSCDDHRQSTGLSQPSYTIIRHSAITRAGLSNYESRFNLWDHDGRIRVRRYAGERCLKERVIERHSGLTTGVMVWGTISYLGRSNLLRIEDNSNSYVHEVLQPEVVSGILGAIFQQDNARLYVAKTVRDLFSSTHATSSLACLFPGYVAY